MTKKQKYIQFLNANFPQLTIRKPLFYNWDTALRFDLQVGEVNTDEYFRTVQARATELFESVFQPEDTIYIVFNDRKWKRRKIRLGNYVFAQIQNLQKEHIIYRKVTGLYEPDDKFDKWNQAIVQTTVEQVNYKNIITAIGHTDFPPREPRLDLLGGFSSKEIYFININNPLIYHMYDDRGLDIIASDKQSIAGIYEKYNDWILDYEREWIDEQMKNNT